MRSLFFLKHDQDRRNDVVELRAPPDATVFVASSLGYPLEPRNVSTILSNLRGSSLACSFALYRALVTGPRLTAMAARHSRDRGGKKGVERPRVVAMESQGRCGPHAHLARAQTSPAMAGVAAEPPRARKEELTGGVTPSATYRGERGRVSARGPSWAKAERAGRVPQCVFFFFFLFKNA